MTLALEHCARLNCEGGRFDVAKHARRRAEFHVLRGANIASHQAVDDRCSHENVRLNFRGFADDERAGLRINKTGRDLAIDAQHAFERE